MSGEIKFPLDPYPYPQDDRSRLLGKGVIDGNYIYVQDVSGQVFVLPDGPHLHPKVLGKRLPSKYAGDLVISGGTITSLTNLSGTFQFDDEEGLRAVANWCLQAGFLIADRAVRFFDPESGQCSVLE